MSDEYIAASDLKALVAEQRELIKELATILHAVLLRGKNFELTVPEMQLELLMGLTEYLGKFKEAEK